MASLHNHKIVAQYQDEVMLGNHVIIKTSLSNMILSYFDYNISFAFESAQLGYQEFERVENNEFSLNLHIPQRPSNYPSVSGKLYALNGKFILAKLSISLTTVYPKKAYQDEINLSKIESAYFIDPKKLHPAIHCMIGDPTISILNYSLLGRKYKALTAFLTAQDYEILDFLAISNTPLLLDADKRKAALFDFLEESRPAVKKIF